MIRKIINFCIDRYKVNGETKLLSLLIFIYLIFYNKTLINKKAKYFLSFEKSRFNLDIEAIQEFSSINILKIPLKMSTTLGKNFLPKFLQSQKNYHITNDAMHVEAKEDYFGFVNEIITNLLKKINIGGLIVGNFDYWEHQEWTKACLNFNIPTICLYRESYSWDAKILWRENLYKNFIHSIPKMEICVFGNQAKNWMENIPVLSNANFHITGSPRTDYHYLNSKIKNNENKFKNLIVLFDYFGQNYGDNVSSCSHHNFKFKDVNIKYCLMCEEDFEDISGEVTSKFISLSSMPELSKYRFVIKTKESYYSKFIKSAFKDELEKTNNIEISNSLNFKDILLDSKIIIGSFRSTAIAESFVSNASIILPYWDNQKNTELDKADNTESLNLYKIKKSDDFEKFFLKILKNNKQFNRELKERRLELINEGLFKIDGLSSKRFEEVLNNI